MTYLLDANVFIEAKRHHYGFDFCPAFWEWLVEANAKGLVFSVEKVLDELAVGGDDLTDWASGLGDAFFLAADAETLRSLAAAVNWARGQQFRQGAINMFADDPDAYLVAHAHAHDLVVVTREKPSDGVKHVKIPNACVGLKVKYMTPYEMLRREKARFVLGRHQ